MVPLNSREFVIDFLNTQEFDITLSENILVLDPSSIPAYEGETIITPKAHDDITLETEGKRMLSDVTVLKVPYYETSNVSGVTVYIGGDE